MRQAIGCIRLPVHEPILPDSFMSMISLAATGLLDAALQSIPCTFARHQVCQTDIEGLSLLVSDRAGTEIHTTVSNSSLCLVLQGRKRVQVGDRSLSYGAMHFACYAIGMPVVITIEQASIERPFCCCVLDLDVPEIKPLVLHESKEPETPPLPQGEALGTIDDRLAMAFVRLLALLDEPENLMALAPLLRQEISYRLLRSSAGRLIRDTVICRSQDRRIRQAVEWLQQDFASPLIIDTMASRVGMSAATFYRHFRQVTSMSPLQYQKVLRLVEARRLLRQSLAGIREIAQQVGYESPSQFSREYRRHFGISPRAERG